MFPYIKKDDSKYFIIFKSSRNKIFVINLQKNPLIKIFLDPKIKCTISYHGRFNSYLNLCFAPAFLKRICMGKSTGCCDPIPKLVQPYVIESYTTKNFFLSVLKSYEKWINSCKIRYNKNDN